MSTQPTTLELRADTSGLQSVRTLLGVIADESQRAEASVRRIVETWSQPNALGSIRSWSEAQGTAFSRMGAVSYPGGSTGSPPSPFASSGLMPRTGTPDLSWDQIHMGAWQERLSSMATERMLNPGYQANVERAHDREMQMMGLPQWRQDLARTMGGPLGRMGLIAGGGYLAHQQLQNWSGAAGTYWQQEAVAAAGMGSGDLGQAMGASVQAGYGRERALTGAAWGAASGAGMGMMGAGAMLAATPVGLPLMIAGALISAATEFGSKAADAMLAKAQAQEQAAVTSLTRFIGDYRGIATSGARAAALGRGVAGPGAYVRQADGSDGLADRYGYSVSEGAQQEAAFAGAGGQGLGTNFLLAASRGWGLDAGTLGGFTKSFSPGQGGGVLRGQSTEQFTRAVIADAIALGVDRARIPEYLQRSAALNAQFAEKGIPVDARALAAVVGGMQVGGLSHPAAFAAAQSMQGYGGGMLQRMAGMRVPQGATDAIMMRAAMQKFGGFDEAMGGIEGLIGSGGMPDFLRQAVTGMGMGGTGVESAIMMQLTGAGGPADAEKMLRSGRAFGFGTETEKQAADRVMSRPDAQILAYDALGKSMEAAAMETKGFAETMRLAMRIVQAGINNFNKNAGTAADRTAAEVDTIGGPLSPDDEQAYQRARRLFGSFGGRMPSTGGGYNAVRRKPGAGPAVGRSFIDLGGM